MSNSRNGKKDKIDWIQFRFVTNGHTTTVQICLQSQHYQRIMNAGNVVTKIIYGPAQSLLNSKSIISRRVPFQLKIWLKWFKTKYTLRLGHRVLVIEYQRVKKSTDSI